MPESYLTCRTVQDMLKNDKKWEGTGEDEFRADQLVDQVIRKSLDLLEFRFDLDDDEQAKKTLQAETLRKVYL